VVIAVFDDGVVVVTPARRRQTLRLMLDTVKEHHLGLLSFALNLGVCKRAEAALDALPVSSSIGDVTRTIPGSCALERATIRMTVESSSMPPWPPWGSLTIYVAAADGTYHVFELEIAHDTDSAYFIISDSHRVSALLSATFGERFVDKRSPRAKVRAQRASAGIARTRSHLARLRATRAPSVRKLAP
jgi:hypothetical protein